MTLMYHYYFRSEMANRFSQLLIAINICDRYKDFIDTQKSAAFNWFGWVKNDKYLFWWVIINYCLSLFSILNRVKPRKFWMGRMKMLVLCNVHKRTQCTYLKEKGFAPPVFLVCLAACCASAPCKPLRALDTIGNCQRPVFSLGVSQVMHKITNLWKFELNRSSKLQENNGRKNTHVAHVVCFADALNSY